MTNNSGNFSTDFDNHSDYAILNMSHHFTTIQQKCWLYMLIFASKTLCIDDEHKISLARLVNYLNVKSTYEIREKILDMGHVQENSAFTYCFEKIRIVDDTVFYSYPENLKLLLSHPCICDVARELTTLQFQSKYSFFLYEFFLYYAAFGATHPIPLGALRHFLGLASYQYTDVKTLYRSVITQALCEINNKTPLIASIKYEKEGTVVVGFKISIVKKKLRVAEFDEDNYWKVHNEKETYGLYLQNAAYARYYKLSEHLREKVDLLYEPWVHEKHPQMANDALPSKELIKKLFLVEFCLSPYEQHYDLWLDREQHATPITQN